MKNLLCTFALILCCAASVFAQASGEITPKGITFPRYTDANRPVAPLTIGTTIFNTSQNTHQYWNGSSWTNVSTPGSGGGPWSAVGGSIFNNTANRVGINSSNPSADLEIQGNSGLIVSAPYTVTTDPPTNTYTMPYNGTLATITANAGRILDPGGNGNFVTNTNYASYITLAPTAITDGIRFTFESLALGGSTVIFSTSSDVNNASAYILSLPGSSSAVGRPFIIRGSIIYIHNKISSGGTSAAGFQLLFENLTVNSTPAVYSEPAGSGLSYNQSIRSFSSGYSRANGYYSTAMGYNSTASGDYSTAMNGGNTNNKSDAFSFGYDSRAMNDKSNQMKMWFSEFQFLTGFANYVTVTNGAITTSNSLAVYSASNTTPISNYGYLSNTTPSTPAGYYNGTTTVPYSIYGSGRILGQEFNAFSDARHKKLRSHSNGATDLALLNQLKVSNYTFIDTVGKGGKMQLGFIAQEVEKVMPEAVNKIQDYIPSIYDMARSIAYDSTAHTLTVTTNKVHDFQSKDEIKLISLEKEHKVKVASVIDANTFVVENWEKPVDKLFVFGKQVNDFRTVDYDRLFTLGISSIQELSRKVARLEQENVLLRATKDEFSQLKSEMATLKAMILKTEKPDKLAEK